MSESLAFRQRLSWSRPGSRPRLVESEGFGDHQGARYSTRSIADLLHLGVQPQIRVGALQGRSRRLGPAHQALAQPRTAVLGYSGQPECFYQPVALPSRHAIDVSLLDQTESGMLFNPLGRQRRITQPTLVVHGAADQIVDPGNAEVLARLVPDARVQRFYGAGHLFCWEQPKRFVPNAC